MYKYLVSLLCVVSVGHIPSFALAQNLSGDYSNCACVTPALSTTADANAATAPNASNAGMVVLTRGDVLVDGKSAEENKLLNRNSQILVGDGQATITVGQSCQISIPNNTQVSISQPGGPGSNLCLQRLDTGVAQENAAGNGALIGTLVVAGTIAAVVVATDDDDRPPSSP